MGRRPLAVALTCAALGAFAAFDACDRLRPSGELRAAPPRPAAPAGAPNVLLLTLDTTRADALRCYGAPDADASPELDALAAGGVRFAQARTTVPMSLPSHASILTGRWPFETGVRDNATFRLGPGHRTLAERLRAAGWSTGAVAGSLVVHSVFGLDQGFDVYSDVKSSGGVSVTHQDERSAAQLTDECLRLLDEKLLAPPFFLWAHYFDPHFPYEPPEPFLSRFLARAKPAGKGRARYAGEVAFMDREIGRLLAQVRARLAGRPLVVVVVGDHGEALGDHGEDSHGMLLYDSTLRVPLLVAGSGVRRGVVVDAPASTVDLLPTLLDLCGVERDEVSGISWAASVRESAADGATSGAAGAGDPEAASDSRPLYYEVLSPHFSYGWSPLFAVGLGPLIFIEGPKPELFDVANDVNETRNLVEAREDVVRLARLQFERWKAAAPAATAESSRPGATAEQRERIAKLGYAGACAEPNMAIPAPGEVDVKLRDPRDGGEILHKMFSAETLIAEGKVERANAICRELLQIDGDNPMLQQLAATGLMTAGNPAAALTLIEKAVARRGDFVMRFTLAQALKQLGRRDDALAVLERLVADHGELLRARLLYGELLLDAGRKAQAKEQLEAYLAGDPKDDEAKRRARELLERAAAQ